jgi:hypothetical protein
LQHYGGQLPGHSITGSDKLNLIDQQSVVFFVVPVQIGLLYKGNNLRHTPLDSHRPRLVQEIRLSLFFLHSCEFKFQFLGIFVFERFNV